MTRVLEYWHRLEEEDGDEEEEGEEFSLEMGGSTDRDIVNSTGIQICIEDATPKRETADQNEPEEDERINDNKEGGTEESHINPEDISGSLPFIDEPTDISKSVDATKGGDATDGFNKNKEEKTDEGYKHGMKKWFQNVSQAQEDAKSLGYDDQKSLVALKSKDSEYESKVSNTLKSAANEDNSQTEMKSKYSLGEDGKLKETDDKLEEDDNFDYRIPVMETSESELEESEYLKFSESESTVKSSFINQGFEDKE